MPVIESLKSKIEWATGAGVPDSKGLRLAIRTRKPRPSRFKDDGDIPNNPRLAFIHYSGAIALKQFSDPAAAFEKLFKANGWGGSWRNGVYDYVHYHPRTHEVLGIARGTARVRFGGRNGKIVRLKAGDVVVLPAGTGHQALSASKDLLVVGAYPPDGKYEEYEGSEQERHKALKMIPKVRLPKKDPVYGSRGPLKRLWKAI